MKEILVKALLIIATVSLFAVVMLGGNTGGGGIKGEIKNIGNKTVTELKSLNP